MEEEKKKKEKTEVKNHRSACIKYEQQANTISTADTHKQEEKNYVPPLCTNMFMQIAHVPAVAAAAAAAFALRAHHQIQMTREKRSIYMQYRLLVIVFKPIEMAPCCCSRFPVRKPNREIQRITSCTNTRARLFFYISCPHVNRVPECI